MKSFLSLILKLDLSERALFIRSSSNNLSVLPSEIGIDISINVLPDLSIYDRSNEFVLKNSEFSTFFMGV